MGLRGFDREIGEPLFEVVLGGRVAGSSLTKFEGVAVLALAQVAQVAINEVQDPPAVLLELRDFIGSQILFVFADVPIVDEFLQRAARLKNKLDMIQPVPASVTFGDVSGERKGRSPNLTGQFKFFEARERSTHRIQGAAKRPRDLIDLKALKRLKSSFATFHILASDIERFNTHQNVFMYSTSASFSSALRSVPY